MSHALRIRYFVPHDGLLRECDAALASKLVKVPREGWRPVPITVGCKDGVTMIYVPTVDGPLRVHVQTGLVRKVVEACIAVGAVHAVVALGMAATP